MAEEDAKQGHLTTSAFLLRAAEDLLEEARAWLTATPSPLNRIEEASVNRFFETGPDLIEALVGAIGCGQHVALAGPRGCGKSRCIRDAITLAQERKLIPTRGFVMIQGNKELPRDYLLEDDMTLSVEDGVVMPKRKDAPLMKFAKRHKDGPKKGRPVVGKDGMVECYGVDADNQIIEAEKLNPSQRIVLFLDEVNRFSDGVLDSLLLLLEEGEAVMGGETFKLPVVVMMTMNPPGYDASARSLSPPLSARIGRQYRLLSPRLDVLTDRIAPEVITKLQVRAEGTVGVDMKLQPPSVALLRRAAAATLCAWGDPRMGNPSFDYLSEETQTLLKSLADSSTPLKAAMRSLNELCSFGPDGRALGDWLVAASVAAANEARTLGLFTAAPSAKHFIACAVTVLSHKLQDNFSSATRPENTRRKEEALYVIAESLLNPTSEEKQKSIDKLVLREVDREEALLFDAFKGFPAELDSSEVRAGFISFGLTERSEINRWTEFLGKLPDISAADTDTVEHKMTEALIESGILERDSGRIAFASKAHSETLKWLSSKLLNSQHGKIFVAMTTIASKEALYVIAESLLNPTSEEKQKSIDKLALREVDREEALLFDAFKGFPAELDSSEVRAGFISFGLTERSEINRWTEFLGKLPDISAADTDTVEHKMTEALIESGILERDSGRIAFASKAHSETLKWLSSKLLNSQHGKIFVAMTTIASKAEHLGEPMERQLEHYSFVRAGVCQHAKGLWALICEAGLIGIPRNTLVALFARLNDVWVLAEHENAQKVVDPLWELIIDPTQRDAVPGVPESHRASAAQFALAMLERMQTQIDRTGLHRNRRLRGGGTRAARRALRNRIAGARIAAPAPDEKAEAQ